MRKLDLLKAKPIKRTVEPGWRTEENKIIAKKYGQEFFDGDRVNGYGGYYYDGRWREVVKTLQEVYNINSDSSILDIGCAKGFLLYDLQDMVPGIKVAGLDISEYAISKTLDKFGEHTIRQQKNKSKEDPLTTEEQEEARKIEQAARNKILPFIIKVSAENLPYPDNSFDVVLAINTIHNLPKPECKKSIQEMLRVCKPNGHIFIQVDAYKTPEDLERMKWWVLTAETMLSEDDWLEFYKEAGFDGDYFWTTF
tara:strand:+ start:1486 stop:2244 length:759 start_codon:yes stop_codon:yes gene_type:complete